MQCLIIETAKQIATEKRTARRVPSYALCYEICSRLNVPQAVAMFCCSRLKTLVKVRSELEISSENQYIV
jgi:hypothetical protein